MFTHLLAKTSLTVLWLYFKCYPDTDGRRFGVGL